LTDAKIPFKSALIVCRPGPRIGDYARRIANFLIDRKIEVYATPDSCPALSEFIIESQIHELEPDFVVTVGGDGTVLYTLSKLKRRDIPLFCINRGSFGFMTETDLDNAIPVLEKVLSGNYWIDEAMNLSSGFGDQIFADAQNEVMVHSAKPGKIMTFDIFLDSVLIERGRADGVIISTPTGSTAYALSAGGSILDPRLNAIIVVPICSPLLELRPIVVPGDSSIEIKITKPHGEGLVVIDGQVSYNIPPLSTVWIKKSKIKTRFIRSVTTFYDRFRTKITREDDNL